jgi:hypothetical protein
MPTTPGPAPADAPRPVPDGVVSRSNGPPLGPASDSITILQARGRRLAKLIRGDGRIEDYDAARRFDLMTAPIAGLDELERVLRSLIFRPDCCIVRGAIADACGTQGVRRLLHPDPQTGDAPTLCDVPRRWLALDIDSIPRPAAVSAADLLACATAACVFR